jgi:hypothetical protein
VFDVVKEKIIDAGNWVPLHRERTFIVGFWEDCGFSFDRFSPPIVIDRPVIEAIVHSENGMEDEESPAYAKSHSLFFSSIFIYFFQLAWISNIIFEIRFSSHAYCV